QTGHPRHFSYCGNSGAACLDSQSHTMALSLVLRMVLGLRSHVCSYPLIERRLFHSLSGALRHDAAWLVGCKLCDDVDIAVPVQPAGGHAPASVDLACHCTQL